MKRCKRADAPKLAEILEEAATLVYEEQWTLRKAMEFVSDKAEETDTFFSVWLQHILAETESIETKNEALADLRDLADDWEGRNNG